MLPRILTGLVGLLMAVITLGWLADPSSAAANLGMPLLDGLGRSTQIGDFTAFFAAIAGFSLYAAWKENAHWARAAATVLLLAALFRTTSWLMHNAVFATQQIVAEVVMGAVLLFAASRWSTASAE